MNASRGMWFVGGAALLAAWFAAAADQGGPGRPAPDASADAGLARAESLARDIQSQASRLRARLADAPEPSPSGRNPFAFDLPRERRMAMPAPSPFVAESPAVIQIDEPPPLSLSGIAEDAAPGDPPAAPVRIAVLSGLGDVFLARAGEIILSRYEVVAVGADAVELKDLTTGRTIRLGLR